MHGGVRIQPVEQRQQFRLAGIFREPVLEGAHARFLRRPALAAHIHLAGRIVADKHHREARLDALRGFEFAGENADTLA